MAYTEAERLALLEQARDQLLDRLVEVTAEANPTYIIDGEMISWNEYLGKLRSELDEIETLINKFKPFEIHHQGFST